MIGKLVLTMLEAAAKTIQSSIVPAFDQTRTLGIVQVPMVLSALLCNAMSIFTLMNPVGRRCHVYTTKSTSPRKRQFAFCLNWCSIWEGKIQKKSIKRNQRDNPGHSDLVRHNSANSRVPEPKSSPNCSPTSLLPGTRG